MDTLRIGVWISEDNQLEPKALGLLQKMKVLFSVQQKEKATALKADDLVRIAEYRELFPKGLLPSGVPARINTRELEKKFTWFFNTYNFSWETILQATRKYIQQYEATGFLYMQNSSYFISKTDRERNTTSFLATGCEHLTDKTDEAAGMRPSKFTVV